MSEKMTTIRLPGQKHSGFQDWGEHTIADMIQQYRDMARYELAWAQEVLAASDEDFRVAITRGVIVAHPIKTLQEGRSTK